MDLYMACTLTVIMRPTIIWGWIGLLPRTDPLFCPLPLPWPRSQDTPFSIPPCDHPPPGATRQHPDVRRFPRSRGVCTHIHLLD
ncbi:hypothetical protein BD779DRAFT_1598679, partial [Infundibulicybe gibba]